MKRIVLVIGAACTPQVRDSAIPPAPPIGAPIDRAGRPLTGNALVGLFDADEIGDRRKEQYNRAAPAGWPAFVPDLERSLALYDGFDGACGNQWRAGAGARYHALAQLLADDRLWIDARLPTGTLFGVERHEDGGGRTPGEDSVDVYRALLVTGARTGVPDGIAHDDHATSATAFPFLAPP